MALTLKTKHYIPLRSKRSITRQLTPVKFTAKQSVLDDKPVYQAQDSIICTLEYQLILLNYRRNHIHEFNLC